MLTNSPVQPERSSHRIKPRRRRPGSPVSNSKIGSSPRTTCASASRTRIEPFPLFVGSISRTTQAPSAPCAPRTRIHPCPRFAKPISRTTQAPPAPSGRRTRIHPRPLCAKPISRTTQTPLAPSLLVDGIHCPSKGAPASERCPLQSIATLQKLRSPHAH